MRQYACANDESVQSFRVHSSSTDSSVQKFQSSDDDGRRDGDGDGDDGTAIQVPDSLPDITVDS